MSVHLSVFTIGGGDLIEEVLNAVATAFNDPAGIAAITSLAVMFGGLFATFEFSKSHDVKVLFKWAGMYVLVTSLVLYPKATVAIEDRTGVDLTPRIVDNVPLSLAIFASLTSRIGIGFTEVIETIFHMPNDMTYNQTGMLMGSKLVLASRDFQITDSEFSQTLNEFMQQCVFFDLLLKKYTVQNLVHADNPWNFIKEHTSQARAFPLNGEITVCNVGAAKLDVMWTQIIKNAASVYGGQILGKNSDPAKALLSHLSVGYNYLTQVSVEGESILKTNLLANAMSSALSHYGANSNAPAALQAYEDTKSELQSRQTMDQTGRQAAVWMQYFVNILEAVLYSSFIFIYFLSYFPFGGAIIRNYLSGLFMLQALAPMYAIINFAANSFAQNRSTAFLLSDPGSHSGLSIANIAGITQANADAMAVAGYLIWPVTLLGGTMLFRGLPGALQSMGQLMGGLVQHAGSHVVAETVGGNISAGNANFGTRSMNNTNANHWDTNVRYGSGGTTLQTGTGSSYSITPDGGQVLDNRAAISNLSTNINWADSTRMVASHQAQSSLSAALNKSHAAGEQYSSAIRRLDDYSQQQSHFINSGHSNSLTDATGLSHSAHTVSQMVDSFAKDHHVTHERAAQVLGQVYADVKGGFELFGTGVGTGGHASGSASARSGFGSLYNEAHRFAVDNNFSETVDSAKRAAVESHFRDSSDKGDRVASSIASSFDKGDNYREEAASQLSKSESYSHMASTSSEQASSVYSNYNQEFYTWMREQRSPTGQGTMSKSAIDNMSVHDTALLQTYANQFVAEKSAKEVSSFDQSHHLNKGGENIQREFGLNNKNIHGQSKIEEQYNHGSQLVRDELKNATEKGGGVGSVDSGIKDKVNSRMIDNNNYLDKQQTALNQGADPLKENIHEKVKGQVLSSLGSTKNSILNKIKHPGSLLDFSKETIDE